MSNQAEAQVTYSFSGIANNLGVGGGGSPQVGPNEPYTATFVVDDSVVDSNPAEIRGDYVGAIISSKVEFAGGYTSLTDFSGGDVIIWTDNPGGGVGFSAPGGAVDGDGGIILYSADFIPFESDSLLVDPDVLSMQTGFWVLNEPDGGINSFSDLDGASVPMRISTAIAPTLYGDVDLNGTVNFSDITPFIEVLSGTGYQAEADCDEDGSITFGDINPFIDALSNQSND